MLGTSRPAAGTGNGRSAASMTGAEVLARHGVTPEPAVAASTARFPDGAHFRIEIPSVEGPAVAAASVPIDLYVEAPDALGGVVRGHEAADLITAAAPMYVKFGLRNARPLYPSGLHIADEAAAIAREKVHRAAVALEWIDRCGPDLVQSGPGAKGLGIPSRLRRRRRAIRRRARRPGRRAAASAPRSPCRGSGSWPRRRRPARRSR
jgi:hypothetical protein